MRGILKLCICAFFTLAVYGLTTSANALTEKEQWEKEYGDAYRLQPLDPPVILEHGGPDPGGYYYIDSFDPALNAPVFNWTDISGIGIAVPLGDDANAGPFPIGFDFTFYGVTFNQFYICSNGWVSFTSTSTSLSNVAIPSANQPNNLLAIFWDDLAPHHGGQVYYYSDAGANRLIISYDGVPHYYNYGSLHFQAVLDGTDSSIVYHYGVMDDGGHGNNSSTVGIENAGGTIGTQYRYNQAGIVDNMAVYFGFEAPIVGEHEVRPVAFIDFPAFGEVGDNVTTEVAFINQGNNAESFPVRLSVNFNGNEIYNQTEQVNNLAPGASANVTFPVFTSTQEGVHEFVAISELSGDENPANDTIRTNHTTYGSMYYENFELTDGYFVGDGEWQWGVPTSGPNGAYSGSKLWATNLGGNYGSDQLGHLVSPPFGLSSNALLAFWLWYDTEANFDGGNVKISTDDGVTWNIITPDGGYDGIGNSSNPLSGEEIYTGHGHDYWQFETFDLSAYGGAAVLFRFDFGSDGSVQYPGFYIDDFTICGGGGAEPGYIDGTVTELSTGNPIQGTVVIGGNAMDTTNASGDYLLELIPGTYSVTASAEYHNPITIDDIVVIESETTTVDFALPTPLINVDTSPIQLQVDSGEVIMVTRNVANIGDGELEFDVEVGMGPITLSVRPGSGIRSFSERIATSREKLMDTRNECSPTFTPGYLPTILDFGDEMFMFDPEGSTSDPRCLGVEFDGTYFWVTGVGDGSGSQNRIHKYDSDGNYIQSFMQNTSSDWGWRDIAWDGEYLYASDDSQIDIFDPVSGTVVGSFSGPENPNRALAYDPATDHFWAKNWGSNIYEFDRTGAVINSYSDPLNLSTYGMAWDDASEDGPWLWIFSQNGPDPNGPLLQINQFDPATGAYTGLVFYGVDNGSDAMAGGAAFSTEWDPAFGIFFGLHQGTPDLVKGYEITPFSQWIIVDPMSGLLQPAENIDLEVTIDFTGDITPDSIYEATILVHNSTPDTPEIHVEVSSTTGIEDVSGLPKVYSLAQNFPNPFNARTSINFALPQQSDVKIEVYNVLGQKTATLAEGLLPAGSYTVTWDASDVASGVYYYKLSAGDYTSIKMMTLLK
ncbi:MAG: carboxypeptidase regulatory-like domain-containing protein [Candidatus Zixiibacteriota bacterium]|nr:MAG: carboxypeptidase regulatory-like domain-containing protein [candidate division Zixibacteria bacterium]